jgi:L-lactate permease
MLTAGSTIACILGIAYLMYYSGMAASIGLAVSQVSARALPPLTVYLGLFGSIVAGSVSGGNALFGGASVFAAKRLGLDSHLIAGTLCSGGTLGKPITPQSLVLAEAAVGHPETDPAPKLISLVFGWALVYSLILFLMVLSYSLFLMP